MNERCTANQWAPFWWCSRPSHHVGPCALRPAWWNVIGRFVEWKASR
jgi:hypothetical protein